MVEFNSRDAKDRSIDSALTSSVHCERVLSCLGGGVIVLTPGRESGVSQGCVAQGTAGNGVVAQMIEGDVGILVVGKGSSDSGHCILFHSCRRRAAVSRPCV